MKPQNSRLTCADIEARVNRRDSVAHRVIVDAVGRAAGAPLHYTASVVARTPLGCGAQVAVVDTPCELQAGRRAAVVLLPHFGFESVADPAWVVDRAPRDVHGDVVWFPLTWKALLYRDRLIAVHRDGPPSLRDEVRDVLLHAAQYAYSAKPGGVLDILDRAHADLVRVLGVRHPGPGSDEVHGAVWDVVLSTDGSWERIDGAVSEAVSVLVALAPEVSR